MKTIKELNEKAWYRFIKVLYVLLIFPYIGFVVAGGFAVFEDIKDTYNFYRVETITITMDIKEFRQQYPQYDHVDDTTLAKKLHEKYYAHVSYETFARKFGVISSATTGGKFYNPGEIVFDKDAQFVKPQGSGMATYEVTAPDGSKYRVTAPDTATEQEVMAYAQKSIGQTTPTSQPTTPLPTPSKTVKLIPVDYDPFAGELPPEEPLTMKKALALKIGKALLVFIVFTFAYFVLMEFLKRSFYYVVTGKVFPKAA